MSHLRAWTVKAIDGSPSDRGIPQGNTASSFLGNFFLKQVDEFFKDHYPSDEVRYFRYVDDIRIVAKSEARARDCALRLEEQIRRLHLNLQSAKTRVLSSSQAIRALTDRRLVALDEIRRAVFTKGHDRADLLRRLDAVAIDKGDSEAAASIKTGRAPVSGLNFRVLRRWSGLHYQLRSAVPLQRIAREVIANPDYRASREAMRVAINFPANLHLPRAIVGFLRSGEVMFDYQAAELVRGLAAFDVVPTGMFDMLAGFVADVRRDPYLRLQAVFALSMYPDFYPEADELVASCISSPDQRVATAAILACSLCIPDQTAKILRQASASASQDTIRLMQYIRAIRSGRLARRVLLHFVFGQPDLCLPRTTQLAPFLRLVATGSPSGSVELASHISACNFATRRESKLGAFLDWLKVACRSNIDAFAARHLSVED